MSTQIFPVGSKVLVFGLGLQGGGEGDVRYLLAHHYDVRVTDKKSKQELDGTLKNLPPGLVGTFGQHKKEDIEWADYILVNPGVNLAIEELEFARKLDKKIVNRTSICVKNLGVPVIGITGTRGKSTTTELIYQMLSLAYPDQILRGGNTPGISDLELLDNIDNKKYAVLELSSFQLEYFHMEKISPQYAIITNLYPDHLNRYRDMKEYALAKSAICNYQTALDTTFVNGDNEACFEISKNCPSQTKLYHATDIKDGNYPHLSGQHNRENMAGVMALGHSLGIDDDLIYETFTNYQGLPFRLEEIATINQVKYINDTTSTTPIATIKAIDNLTSPTILILGGAEKSLPTQEMFEAIKNNDLVKSVIILGSRNNQAIAQALFSLTPKLIGRADSMQEAVSLASKMAKPLETVLLSPGFASFDLFKNEFDRGVQFNQLVAKLK